MPHRLIAVHRPGGAGGEPRRRPLRLHHQGAGDGTVRPRPTSRRAISCCRRSAGRRTRARPSPPPPGRGARTGGRPRRGWLHASGGAASREHGTTRELTAADVGSTTRLGHRDEPRRLDEATPPRPRSSSPAPPVNTTPPRSPGGRPSADPHRERRNLDAPDQTSSSAGCAASATCATIANDTGPTLLLTGADAGTTVKAEVTHAGVVGDIDRHGRRRARHLHARGLRGPRDGRGVGADGVLPDGWSHGARSRRPRTPPRTRAAPAAARASRSPPRAATPRPSSTTTRPSTTARPSTSTSSARRSTATAR